MCTSISCILEEHMLSCPSCDFGIPKHMIDLDINVFAPKKVYIFRYLLSYSLAFLYLAEPKQVRLLN